MRYWVFFSFAVLGLTACQAPLSTTYTVHAGTNGELETHTYSSDLRSVHIIEKDGGVWVMAEPPPDSALSTANNFDLSLSLAHFSGGGQDSDDSSSETESVGLDGRTVSVVLARELMYRLNEMAHNTKMDAAQYQATFDKVLTLVQAVAVQEMDHSNFTDGYKAAVQATQSLSDANTTDASGQDAKQSGSSGGSGDGSGQIQ